MLLLQVVFKLRNRFVFPVRTHEVTPERIGTRSVTRWKLTICPCSYVFISSIQFLTVPRFPFRELPFDRIPVGPGRQADVFFKTSAEMKRVRITTGLRNGLDGGIALI